MEIRYSKELTDYLRGRKKRNISIEVASSDHSDFDVTELYVRLVDDSFADYLIEKKRYQAFPAEEGRLLLPPYHLELSEEICLDIRKVLWFHRITYTGVAL